MVDLSLPMAIADARNPEHPLIWVNRAFSEIAGLPPEHLLHRPHPLITPDPTSPYPEVRSWTLPDGAVRWYRQSCHTQEGDDDSNQLVLTFTDVTALVGQLELYRAVVDRHPAMVIVANQEGDIELSNATAVEVLGWPLGQMTVPEVLQSAYPNPADLESVIHAVTEASGEWQDFQTRTADGRMLETRWMNLPLDHGRRLGIGQDVTAQRWQWRSMRLLHQLIGDLHHLNCTDPDTFLAQTAKRLVEAFQVEWCVIRLCTEVGLVPFVSHPDIPWLLPADHPLWPMLFNHEGVLVLDSQLDSEVNLPSVQSLMATAIRAQGKTYGAITLKFCQHPYSWQPQERHLLESIAAQLGVALAYRETLRHEQQLGQVKMDFLSLISHELRTPMNGILAMADLLLSSALTPSQRQQLQVLRSSGETLLNILRDMLDLARLEVNELGVQSQPMVLREWLTQFLMPFHQSAQLKGLDFSVACDPSLPTQIDCDPTRLSQILGNLLDHALHWTEQGHIALRFEPWGTAHFMVTVRDTGAGIAPTQLAEVFDPYVPTHTLRSREGVALGLAIARSLVQRLGGTLWAMSGSVVGGHPPAGWQPHPEDVLSTLQGGCVFQFTVPKMLTASSHLSVPVAMTSPPRPHVPLRVLLAEDNDLNQKIALMMLEKLSCTATVARDGQGALDALQEAEFDLVLMDVNMPVMDGLTATRTIRSLMGKTIPIVAVTASALPEDRDRCLAAGMDRVLFKPLRMEELAAVISDYQPQPSLQPCPKLPEPILPPEAPRLDDQILTELLTVSGGDHTFISEVIDTFLSGTGELIPAMERAFQERDYATLGQLTHRLKSNSASVGAIALGAICRKLEELIKDLAEDSAVHRQTRQLLGTLTQELRLSAQALDHQYGRLFSPHSCR